jgi:hypothetical protein
VKRWRALAAATTIAAGGGLTLPCPAHAGAALDDPLQIQCHLESARLDFGRLNLHRPPPTAGEGEVVAVCLNPSPTVRRAALTLAFPTMGPQTGTLQGAKGQLAVAFYRDAQGAERWGDDRNGAPAVAVQVDLGPGEQKRLRLAVHALLQTRRDAPAGAYLAQIPVTLTTVPN